MMKLTMVKIPKLHCLGQNEQSNNNIVGNAETTTTTTIRDIHGCYIQGIISLG